MQLPKNLVIILTIALPLSLIMLVARELEAAANHGGTRLMPKALSDGSPVDANQIDTDHKQENDLEIGLNSTVLDWGNYLLRDVGLYETVAITADLQITKTNGGGNAVAGETYNYILTVKNHGPSSSTSSTISDTLPAGWTFDSDSNGDCSSAGGGFTCTVTVLEPDASQSFTATVKVPADAQAGTTVTNTATVFGNEDPKPDNDKGSATTTITASADLSLSKTGVGGSAVAGTTHDYILTVTNHGPSKSPPGGTISDTLPAGWSFSSDVGNDCTPVTGGFTCTVGLLAVTDFQSFTATVKVPADAQAGTTVTNTATVFGNEDPKPDNDKGSATTTITASADLSLSKTGVGSSAVAGTTHDYILTVTNNGPSKSPPGGTISDTLPAGWTFQSDVGGVCSSAGGGFECTVGLLAVGESQSFNVTVNVPADALPGLATNTATVFGKKDPNPDNDTDDADTTITTSADLAISKTGTPSIVEVGGTVTYILDIDNKGPSLARDVRVVDSLPPGVTLISATASQGSCSGTSTINCSLENINANGDASVTLVVSLDSVPPGSLENTASVTSVTTDPEDKNNSDTSTTVVLETVISLFLPIIEKQRPFGEPNDTCETAAPIALNITHSFLPEDKHDWYQFDLPSDGNLVVELSNFVPQDGQLTVYFAPDCSSRDRDDVIGINGNSTTRKVLNLDTRPAGHYFIYVSNDAAPSTTPYFLQVKFTP